MLRRAGYLAITIGLLISGALPVAWAANSRVQQAHVRRIKACVLRIPSMGEPIASNGPAHPFPTNSPPDPDAILGETPVPPPLVPSPPPWRWRSTAANQLLFNTLNSRVDMKPDGWEFYNPAAPPYATLEIELRFRDKNNNPVYPQGTPIKVASAPYWEVVLSEANYNALAEMDVIYIPISRIDVTKLPSNVVPIPTYFTEEQRRVLTRLADSGVTLWVDWAIGAATMTGVMGGDEKPGTTNPLERNRNAFFTNLDFATSGNAVAEAPKVMHPLLSGPYVLDPTEAQNVGSAYKANDPRPSIGRVLELRARDMQPSCNFATVVSTTGAPDPRDGAYIAAARFGAGYVVATAGNVGGALGSASSAEVEDLKFAYNLCAWSSEVSAQQKNGRHTAQSNVQINGMIEQWSYPHLTPQAGGLWEPYPPRTMAVGNLPINPVSPLIVNNVVISANLWLNGGTPVSELNAFEVRGEDDFDENRFIDDPLNPSSPANHPFADISVGQSYDRIMGAPVGGPIYGLTLGEVPEQDPTLRQGTKAYVFAVGSTGLFSLPAPRPNLPASDYWNNGGVIKQAPNINVKYNAAPGFAILPGTGGYTRAQIYAGGVATAQAFGSSFNGKLVSWGVNTGGQFTTAPEWYYPPNQESNRMGLISGPVVTANLVDEGTGAIDTMVLTTSCASGDVSGQQNANGAGDTTGKVEGFIVATRGDVLTFPKNTQQPGANTPNAGRRFVCARWIDVPPGQGQVPQARELMWDPSRHFEVRVMDKQRNYVYMRFVPGDAGFNLLPDGTAGQVELPMPPAAFAVPGQPAMWDTSRFVFLADYSPLPQPVDQGGATIRPRFSPQTPYERGLQQIVEPTGIAGGVAVGSDNRVYYGTGKGYMCAVEWNRGRAQFAWKMRGAGDFPRLGQSQNVDPTSPGYLSDYAFVAAPAAGRRIVFASKTGSVYVMEPDATIRGKILPPVTASPKWPLTSVTASEVMLLADHGVGFNGNSPYIRSNQQPWGRLPNQFTVDPDTATVTFNNMENFSLDLNSALSSDQVQLTYGIDTQGKPAVVIPWKFVGDMGNGSGFVVVPLPIVAVYKPAAAEQWLSGPVIAGDRVYIMGASGILHEFPLDPKTIDPSFPKRNSGVVGFNGYNVGDITLYPPNGLVKTRNIAAGPGMPLTVAAPAIGDKFVAICTPRGLTTYGAPNVVVADSNRVVEATGDATAVASTDVVVKHHLNLSDFAIPTDPAPGFSGVILTERQFLNRPAVVRKLNRSGSLTSLFNSSNGTVPPDPMDPKAAITENSVLADESYLAADTGNNRVVEFNPAGKVVGEWNAFQDPFNILPPGETTKIAGPMDVQRWVETESTNGGDVYVLHTLIADTGNFRVIEIVDKILYQAGNFNSGSYATIAGQVGSDGQAVRWYHVLVWSSQTNAQGLKLRYRNAQRIFWPDNNGNLIPVASTASGSRVASGSPPYLPDERFLSYTMATVQGQTIQYPTQGVTVNGYHQYYGSPVASVIDRLPQAKPGGDSIVFLRGRYKVDETSGGSAVPVTGTAMGTAFSVREAKPGSPTNADRYRFAQGVVDPNVPIITEIADEVTTSGPVSANPVHRLNGVSSIQRTIRSDVKFAPWTYGGSVPVRYPYFLVADVDGVWECRMLPGSSPARFSLTMAFTNEDYAYITGAGNGDPTKIYSTTAGDHTPGGRRFSAASARRMPNGQILITSRTGANDLPQSGASPAFYHWRVGADVFLLRGTDYLTASERAARGLAPAYNRIDVATHGWQPDLWVQKAFGGTVPLALQGAPSIRWRASEPANPLAPPSQRTQFIAPPAANPSDLFGSYAPSQPAFADLVY